MSDAFQEKDYTTVNFAAVSDLTTEWSSTATEFESAYQKAVPDATFIKLEDLGYSAGFPSKFDEAMAGLVANVNKVIGEANSYFEQLKSEDSTLAGLFPEEPKGDDPGGDTGGGGGGSSGTDNSADQVAFFKDMSLSDLKGVLDVLKKYAQEQGIPLDVLLNDPKYANAIKELLLSSPNISENYKTLIEQGTATGTQTALKALMNAEVPEAVGLTRATQLTTKKYLQDIAKSNNISLTDLLKDNNTKILSKALADMKGVTDAIALFKEDNVQANLKSILEGTFNGVKLSEPAKNVFKAHLNALSELAACDIDEILTDDSFKHDLFLSIENLNRNVEYLSAVSACEDVGSMIGKIIGA